MLKMAKYQANNVAIWSHWLRAVERERVSFKSKQTFER